MPGIKVKDNESLDNALARFKKQCSKIWCPCRNT